MFFELRKILDAHALELNDQATRSKIRREVALHFRTLNVICDNTNNTPETVNKNEVWIEIDGRKFVYSPNPYGGAPSLVEH